MLLVYSKVLGVPRTMIIQSNANSLSRVYGRHTNTATENMSHRERDRSSLEESGMVCYYNIFLSGNSFLLHVR
jgi:hypothetical protein